MKNSFLNFVKDFALKAHEEIKELAKTELNNKEKKEKLDKAMVAFAEVILAKTKINGFVRFLIKKLVIPNVDEVTQVIFDLLKAKIDKKEEQKGDDKGQENNDTKDNKDGNK